MNLSVCCQQNGAWSLVLKSLYWHAKSVSGVLSSQLETGMTSKLMRKYSVGLKGCLSQSSEDCGAFAGSTIGHWAAGIRVRVGVDGTRHG